MDPFIFGDNLELFNKYLSKSNVYLEFGSGGSTYSAIHTHNVSHVEFVESDPEWFKKVSDACPRAVGHFIDIDTIPRTGGNPGPKASIENMKSYSDVFVKGVDTVFIDGRFRVSCALKIHSKIDDDCVVLFDDFLNRPQYHIVKEYYDIIEHGTQLVVMKKRCDTTVTSDMMDKYDTFKD